MNIEKEKTAISYLKHFEPKWNEGGDVKPYLLCYSGGKDSDAILILAKLAGVNFEAVHNLTTVDAPETVNYIKSKTDVKINCSDTSMWKLIVEKGMPPTRIVRYCCRELKERGGRGRKKITGVRWAESVSRKQNQGLVTVIGKEKTMRKLAEEAGVDYEESKKGGMVLNHDNSEARAFVDHCYRTASVMVNPIVDWSDTDVWNFLHYYGIKSNPLYQAEESGGTFRPKGCTRIGCIGCPMQGSKGMIEDFIKYPIYRDNYLRAFKRMLDARRLRDLPTTWKEPWEVFMWWVGDDPNQLSLFGSPEYLKDAHV